MSTTFQTYNGDGSNKVFTFTVPYIDSADVKARVNAVLTTAFSISGSTVTFTTAPPSGSGNVKIFRDTNNASIEANFQSGSALRAVDFNDNFTQLLFVTQESTDVADTATTDAANSVISANNAVTVSTAANTNSTNAVNTSNTALANSTAAQSAAAGAVTDATAALNNSRESDGSGGFNTAIDKAILSLSTSNSAAGNASNSLSIANTASANATTALNTANAAAAAVSSVAFYTPVAAIANLPGSPSNEDRVEVINSTGVQSSSSVSGVPSGFVGSTDLTVRLQYNSSTSKWVWQQYFAADPENRYLTESLPVVKGDSTNGSGQITLNCENNSHGVKIKGPPHSASATYTLTLPNNTGTNGQFLSTNGSGVMSWATMTQILVADGGNFDSGSSLVTSSSTFDGGSF